MSLDAVPAAVIAVDLDSRILAWNAGAELLYGWTADEVLGRSVRDFVLAGQPRADEVREALLRGEVWAGELEVRHRDGSRLLVYVRNAPWFDPDGDVVGVVGASTQLSAPRRLEAQRAEALTRTAEQLDAAVGRLQRLQRLSRDLLAATTEAAVVDAVLTAGKEAMGAAAIAVALPDPGKEHLRMRQHSGFSEVFVRDFTTLPLTVDTPLTRAYLQQQPQLYADAWSMRQAFPDIPLDPAMEARAAVPVLGPQGCLGGLTLGFAEARVFDTDEVEHLLAVGEQAGQALARVRLAESQLLQRQRESFLGRASSALHASFDTGDIVTAAVQLPVPELADWAVVHLEAPDSSTPAYEVAAVAHREPRRADAMAHLVGTRAVEGLPGGPAEVTRTRLTAVHPDLHPLVADRLQSAPAELAMAAVDTGVVVPLVSGERCWGTLTMARQGRVYEPGEVQVLEELGVRTATALSHATAYHASRQQALELQRTLLPDALPAIPGLDLGWQYLPGTEGARVGGDWYDVLDLGAGRVALVIGDVMGRGTAAAAVMGQLRALARGLLRVGLAAPAVLAEMNDELQRTAPDVLATTLLVELDVTSGDGALANAGHLPPVLLDGAEARLHGTEPGLPLGLPAPPAVSQPFRLSPGQGLLLYTDGLVERRDQSLEEGLQQLVGHCRALPDDVSAATVRVLAGMGRDDRSGDDIAMLLVRRR